MKKSISHRIIASCMAVLMLVSSTGFSMDMHFCQDYLVSISLLGKAQCCGNMTATPPCHATPNDTIETDEDDCCRNQTVIVEKSDMEATTPSTPQLTDIDITVITAFVVVYLLDIEIVTDPPTFLIYKPPSLHSGDLQVLYQTFLM